MGNHNCALNNLVARQHRPLSRFHAMIAKAMTWPLDVALSLGVWVLRWIHGN